MRRFAALFAILFAFPVWAQTVAIRAGNIIDPATGRVATNQIILIKDQKTADIGPSVSIPSDAQVIDLSNEWLMPGVMDTHTHVTFLEHDLQHTLETNYLIEGKGTRVLFGLKTSQILLNAGITTVRDVGNEAEYASVDVRNAINRGWFTGPTILTSGKIIAPFGGQGKHLPPEVGPIWRYEYIDADGPEEIRKAVRENIFYGADLIKLVSVTPAPTTTRKRKFALLPTKPTAQIAPWPSTFSADKPLATSSWAAPIRSSTAGTSTTTCCG